MFSQLYYGIQRNRALHISSEEIIYVAFLLFFFHPEHYQNYDSLSALTVSGSVGIWFCYIAYSFRWHNHYGGWFFIWMAFPQFLIISFGPIVYILLMQIYYLLEWFESCQCEPHIMWREHWLFYWWVVLRLFELDDSNWCRLFLEKSPFIMTDCCFDSDETVD